MNTYQKIGAGIAAAGVLMLVVIIAIMIYSADLPALVRYAIVAVTMLNTGALVYLLVRPDEPEEEDHLNEGTWDAVTFTRSIRDEPVLTLELKGPQAPAVADRMMKATKENRLW